MREIVCIQGGKCGNQIGSKFWEVLDDANNSASPGAQDAPAAAPAAASNTPALPIALASLSPQSQQYFPHVEMRPFEHESQREPRSAADPSSVALSMAGRAKLEEPKERQLEGIRSVEVKAGLLKHTQPEKDDSQGVAPANTADANASQRAPKPKEQDPKAAAERAEQQPKAIQDVEKAN